MIEMRILCFCFFFYIFRLWITTTFCTAKSFSFILKRANFFLFVYVCFLEFNFRNDFSKALQLYRFRTRSKRQSIQRNVYFFIDFFFFFQKVAQILLVLLLLFCYSSSEVVPLANG